MKNSKEASDKAGGKKAEKPDIYFVAGYGNIVGAKSQADAEKRATKILADRRR